MAEATPNKSQETTPKEYSREGISSEKRKSESRNILTANNNADLKKTEEGRAKLSTQWMDRANLSGAQKQQILTELGVISPNNPKEIDEKVKAWQKEHGLVDPKTKEPDGILGWATLEAIDNVIEAADKKSDKDSKKVADTKEGYGLARTRFHEKKAVETYLAEQKKKGSKESPDTSSEANPTLTAVQGLATEESPASVSNPTADQDKNFLDTTIRYNGQDFTVGKMQIRDLKGGLMKSIGNPADKKMAEEIAKSVETYPALGSLTVEQYKRFQKDPADFILSKDTDNLPLFRTAISYATNGVTTYEETKLLKGEEFDLSKTTGFGNEGEMYKKDPDTKTWSRQIGDKIQIGDGGKFISIEEYLAKNADKISLESIPKLVGGYRLSVTADGAIALFKGLKPVTVYRENTEKNWLAQNN